MKLLISLIFTVILSVPSVFAASFRKINVDSALKKQIKILVEMSKDLHELTYTSNAVETKVLLKKMEDQIKKTKAIVVDDGPSAKYLLSLFNDMEGSLIKAKDLEKQKQRDTLKISFAKITRVTQGFDVGNYRTFYCQRFKDLWIQRSWVVKNPIHPKSRCGVLVN